MGAAENKALIQNTFDAWAKGDANAFFSLLADDVQWTVIGTGPVSATYTSRQDFLDRAVGPLTGKLEGGIAPTVVDLLADGDKVALCWEGHATAKNGVPYDQVYCWVMRLDGGKVVEGTAYLDTELVARVFA